MKIAIFSDFDILGHFLNVSGILQNDPYASKSAVYSEVEKGASGASAARVKISQLV